MLQAASVKNFEVLSIKRARGLQKMGTWLY